MRNVTADNQQKTLNQKVREECNPLLPIFQADVEWRRFMSDKASKKEHIRNQIIKASHIYRDELAGKVFLYVVGDECFEVVFKTDRFMHLTGVNSILGAQAFYNMAKSSKLTTSQFYFDNQHSFASAKNKLLCLLMLPSLTNSLVCVVKDFHTLTLTYKIGVTNLDFTIGLEPFADANGNLIEGRFVPRTLRVKDKAIENSREAEFVDFIFSKAATVSKYDTMAFRDGTKSFPEIIKQMLAQNLTEISS